MGPILRATYPTFPLDHPLIFGSILQCLMRKENGNVIHEKDFILKKGQKHNFGPLTAQLKENWRMVCFVIITFFFNLILFELITFSIFHSYFRIKN